MTHEDDFPEEILKASPLLAAFLGGDLSENIEEVRKLADALTQEIVELKGKPLASLSGAVATSFFLALGVVPRNDFVEHYAFASGVYGLISTIGYEIGKNSPNSEVVIFFAKEITEKAISEGFLCPSTLVSDENEAETITYKAVRTALITGTALTAAWPDDPGLDPYRNFLDKLNL